MLAGQTVFSIVSGALLDVHNIMSHPCAGEYGGLTTSQARCGALEAVLTL